jgi:hypothetical protein
VLGRDGFPVRTGYGAEVAHHPQVKPDHNVNDLSAAVQTIRRLIGECENGVKQ